MVWAARFDFDPDNVLSNYGALATITQGNYTSYVVRHKQLSAPSASLRNNHVYRSVPRLLDGLSHRHEVEEREEAVKRTIRASANWPDGSRRRYQKVIASVNV